MQQQDEVLAIVAPSVPRRVFGLLVLFVLGGTVLYLGLARDHSSTGWQLFLMVFGLMVLLLAERMRRATAGRLELTRDGLRDGTGAPVAPLEQIEKVERGTFAIKPSNGFMVKLKQAGPRAWAPGLWWRMGRRVGVGGVTAAAQTKIMAEMIEALVAERDGLLPPGDGACCR